MDDADRAYAELHCHSNFSFLDGASHPEELAEEAARLGLAALALTDHDGFYGVVRFAEAARTLALPTVFGAELTLGAREPPNGMADPPVPAELVDAHGAPISVNGRGEQRGAPARVHCGALPAGGGPVRAWAGPWAHDVRWWDARERRRCARWQVVVDDVACIVVVEGGRAGVEAVYD